MQKVQLKKFITEALKEGVMEAETTQISRQIINWLKTNSSKQLEFLFNNKYRVIVTPYPHKTKLAVINGLYNRNFKTIEINIYLPQEFSKQQLSAFIFRLKEIIRHELEHARQSERSAKELEPTHYSVERDAKYKSNYDSDTFRFLSTARDYFLGSRETEAFVAGLYKRAKMTKEPLVSLIDDRIQEIKEILKHNLMDKWEIDLLAREIRNSWIEYAMARYPNIDPNPFGALP